MVLRAPASPSKRELALKGKMADDSVTNDSGKKDMEPQRKTLFVRNLPYATTDKELEDAFSEYGPIKRSFVVKDKDSSKLCRGFGYVAFVLPEDAAKALNAGISLHGRKAVLSVADKKPRKRDNYKPKINQSSGGTKEEPKELEEDEVHEEKEKKQLNQRTDDRADEVKRTIVISGLPSTATKSKLKLLCCKFGKVKKIEFPAPGRDESTSFITFKSIKGTVRSFQKLNGSKFDSTIINSYLLAKEGKHPTKKNLDQSKLIVRNIAFKCNEKELKTAFQKFGEIDNIDLPTKIDERGRKRMRGFAFVQFKNKDHAKSAIKELNKTVIHGRPIIIDWAVPKDEFMSKNENENKGTKGDKAEEKFSKATGKKMKSSIDDMEETEEEENVEDDDGEGREDEDTDVESEDREEIKTPSTNNSKFADEEGSEENKDDSDEDDSSNDGSDEDWESKIPEEAKKRSHDVKEGRTIFLRNLPFETSEEELNDLFSKYGQIFYSKIVVDQETGHSRGSAFVKFKDPATVEKVLLDAESEDPRNGGVFLGGRKLIIMKAVTRGKVMEFEKQRKDSKKDPKDKRNLSLAQEGVIFPNSEAAKEISDADMKKREKAWSEKKAKLKNQNYFISRTRLCIRNLPLTVGEKELRTAIVKAVSRKGKISKIRVMRSKERLDKSGKGRSLGYAFVEFESHEHALAALRALNNNPEIFGDARRPIVEFSVENKVALELQEKRRERRNLKAANVGLNNDTNRVGAPEEKRRKGKKFGKDLKARKDRSEAVGKKRGREKMEKVKGRGLENHVKAQETKDGTYIRKKRPKIEARREEKSNKERLSYNAKYRNPSQNKKEKQTTTRKRKKDLEDTKTFKTPTKKKMRKQGKTDKEEDSFNLLVSKYKEKLFAESGSKRNNEKRWFEG